MLAAAQEWPESRYDSTRLWGEGMTVFDSELGRDPRFAIERRLGSGSMGVVYAVRDRERGETVALKTLHKRDAATLYRFKKEFRTLADVTHRNLVTLHELIADGERCFLTMELVEGTSFIDHVRPAAAGCDVGRLRPALCQLVDGVQALHDAGLLHRDLKPSNVLVNAAGRVVILDVGLATEWAPKFHPKTVDIELAATLAYAAPEQAQGEDAGRASDWYAVGAILYQALTGQLPFPGALPQMLLGKLRQEAPSPAELEPDLPVDLVELCRQLLARDPAHRPVGESLVARLGGREAGPRMAGPHEASDPGVRRPAPPRRRELAALREAFAAAGGGQAVSVCVHGPAGGGKTSLVHAFLEQLATESPVVVLAGRCHRRERVPLKALDGVVDSLSKYLLGLAAPELEALLPDDVRALTELFPVLLRVEAVETAALGQRRDAPRGPGRPRAVAALRELLGRIAERRPLVIFIDDLQWADADSTSLVDDLLCPPAPPALLLVACFRSEEVAEKPFLGELLERPGTETHRQLAVQPLG